MMIKLIIAFCVFQMAFGQEDPEQDLRDFVAQTNEAILYDVGFYLNRILQLATYVDDANKQLFYKDTELRQELEILAVQLRNNTDNVIIDVTDCLITALDNVDTIMLDRRNEMEVFYTIAYNNLEQVVSDICLVSNEEVNLMRQTEDSIKTCRAAPTTEEVNICYSQLVPIFDEMTDDIRKRLNNLTSLGVEVLSISEGTLRGFLDDNIPYIDEKAQDIRHSLTECIEDLY